MWHYYNMHALLATTVARSAQIFDQFTISSVPVHCLPAISSTPSMVYANNNDVLFTQNKLMNCFPAHDDLGTCRTDQTCCASWQQPVLSVPSKN